jgi:hypothetical protein
MRSFQESDQSTLLLFYYTFVRWNFKYSYSILLSTFSDISYSLLSSTLCIDSSYSACGSFTSAALLSLLHAVLLFKSVPSFSILSPTLFLFIDSYLVCGKSHTSKVYYKLVDYFLQSTFLISYPQVVIIYCEGITLECRLGGINGF